MSDSSFQNSSDQQYYLKLSSKLIRDNKRPLMERKKEDQSEGELVSVPEWMCSKMLLIGLLDKPKDWRIYPEQVSDETGAAVDTIRRWLNILIIAGYVNRRMYRDERGRSLETVYFIHDERKPRDSSDIRIRRFDYHEMKRIEADRKLLAKEENELKTRTSYEQGFSEEKPAHSMVSTTPLLTSSGRTSTRQLDPKYKSSKVSLNSCTTEDPPRSQVHNSERSCKPAQHDGQTPEAKARESFKAFKGSGFAGASKAAKILIKQRNIQESEAIDELQSTFIAHWDELDVLSEAICWKQLYATLDECRYQWDISKKIGRKIKSPFSYYLKALKNYISHLHDSSLAQIENSLDYMSKRYS